MDTIKLNYLRGKSALAKLCLKMVSARNSRSRRAVARLPGPVHLRLAFFGALGLAAMLVLAPLRPAMAGSHSTGHFIVSVNVVYHCEIGASVALHGNTVNMTMHHCANQPRVSSPSLSNAGAHALPGAFNTWYTLKATSNSATSRVRYINVTF